MAVPALDGAWCHWWFLDGYRRLAALIGRNPAPFATSGVIKRPLSIAQRRRCAMNHAARYVKPSIR